MLRAALKKSTTFTFSKFISQTRSYTPYFVHYSAESENRTTELLSDLLRANDSCKWKRIASMPHIFVKLTPSVIRSIIEESRDVDVSRLMRFFHWCEDELGIQHELSSFSIVAVALCNAENFSDCRLFVRRMVAIFGSPLIVLGSLVKCYREIEGSNGQLFDTLVDVYRKKGRLVDACNVFLASNVVGHEPGMLLLNLLLRDLSKAEMMDEFWKVCEGMAEADIKPDISAYTNMIKAYLKCGDVDGAKNVLYEMEGNGCGESSICTYNLVIEALCGIGNLDEAIQLGKAMMVKGLYPDVCTFSTLIDGFQRNKRTGDVASLLSEIKGMGLNPDAVTYNDLIDGLFKQGDFTQAFKVWYEMHASGVQMNVSLYDTILSGVRKADKINRVPEIASQMIVRGIEPDFHTRNMLMRGYLAKKDVGKTIEPTVLPNGLKISQIANSSSLDSLICILRE